MGAEDCQKFESSMALTTIAEAKAALKVNAELNIVPSCSQRL